MLASYDWSKDWNKVSGSFSPLSGYEGRNTTQQLRPFTSVIIPVYKNTEGLHILLKALEIQTYPRNCYEVIVVNNDSSEDLAVVKEEFHCVRIITEDKEGSYYARNRGILASRGEILAFTDSDCIPEPDWLENGVRALREIGNTGMIAGHIEVTMLDPLLPTASEIYDRLCSFRQKEFLEKDKYGVTANLLTSTVTMKAVGPFDPRLKSGGDCEWSVRVFRHGFPQLYCPRTIIRHPAQRSLKSLIKKSLRITIGTMETREKFNFTEKNLKQYIWQHLVKRPADLIEKMNHMELSISPFMTFQVIGIYFLIKGLQLLERVRVSLGWENRR